MRYYPVDVRMRWLHRVTENARFAKFSKFSKSKTLIFNKLRFTKSARFSKLDVLSQPVQPRGKKSLVFDDGGRITTYTEDFQCVFLYYDQWLMTNKMCVLIFKFLRNSY